MLTWPDSHLQEDYQVIYVNSHGDYLVNRSDILNRLYSTSISQPVLLHFCYQAISITESGLIYDLDQYISVSGRSRKTIFIHTPSREEDYLGFTNIFSYPVCDEFLRCRNYWVDDPNKPNHGAFRFGHFVGRPTTPRIKFFYDIEKYKINHNFLLSKLNDDCLGDWNYPENYYDDLNHWFDTSDEQKKFTEWHETEFSIASIDELNLADQYDITKTARLNIVNQSYKYHVDIVFESLTIGNTFAPTEKLIRSLITEKPFIVYASKYYLQRLKRMGFKTFDQLWNEDYDNFDFVQRYDKILKLSNDLAKLSQKDFLFLMESTREMCIHNKQLLKQLNVDYHGSEEYWINNTSNLLIS